MRSLGHLEAPKQLRRHLGRRHHVHQSVMAAHGAHRHVYAWARMTSSSGRQTAHLSRQGQQSHCTNCRQGKQGRHREGSDCCGVAYPSWPKVPRPQVNIAPEAETAAECQPLHETVSILSPSKCSLLITVGDAMYCLFPCPSWPKELSPHVNSLQEGEHASRARLSLRRDFEVSTMLACRLQLRSVTVPLCLRLSIRQPMYLSARPPIFAETRSALIHRGQRRGQTSVTFPRRSRRNSGRTRTMPPSTTALEMMWMMSKRSKRRTRSMTLMRRTPLCTDTLALRWGWKGTRTWPGLRWRFSRACSCPIPAAVAHPERRRASGAHQALPCVTAEVLPRTYNLWIDPEQLCL